MAIDSSRMTSAVQAYADATRNVTQRSSEIQQEAPPNLPGPRPAPFTDMVRASVEEAVDTHRVAETQSMLAVAGQADLAEVVTAVADAELTLQTVVSIRDRVVQAYQDIIRMPI